MAVTLYKIVRLTGFFSKGSGYSNEVFLFFESYHFQKIISENVKKLNFVATILDFWWPSWIDNGYFLTLYSIHLNDHSYQLWCFYTKVYDRHFFSPIDWTMSLEPMSYSIVLNDYFNLYHHYYNQSFNFVFNYICILAYL